MNSQLVQPTNCGSTAEEAIKPKSSQATPVTNSYSNEAEAGSCSGQEFSGPAAHENHHESF